MSPRMFYVAVFYLVESYVHLMFYLYVETPTVTQPYILSIYVDIDKIIFHCL